MANSTVNDEKERRYPKEITERAGDSSDNLKFVYIACGKEVDENKKMKAKKNKKQPEYSLIDHLRENGEIVVETDKTASIKVYSNRETIKSTKQQEDRGH